MILLKPHQLEGKITLTQAQRAKKRAELYRKQSGQCADGCQKPMIEMQGYMDSATLEHIIPEPAGCKKRDNDDNLCVTRWECNMRKGSRRSL